MPQHHKTYAEEHRPHNGTLKLELVVSWFIVEYMRIYEEDSSSVDGLALDIYAQTSSSGK